MKTLSAILIVGLAAAGSAQTLSLADAEELAKERHPLVLEAKARIAAAEAEASGLLSPFKPQISLNGYAAGGGGSMIFPSMTAPRNYARLPVGNTAIANVMVSWRVWSSGRDKLSAQIGGAKMAFAEQLLRAAQVQAVFEVREAFADAEFRAAHLVHGNSAINRAEQALADTHALVKAGKLAEAFVYRAEAELAAARRHDAVTQANYDAAEAHLAHAAGLPAPRELTTWTADLIAPKDLASAITGANLSRPEISLWRALAEQRSAEADYAGKALGPDVSFMAMSSGGSAGGSSLDPTGKAGLVFSWTLEDGGSRKNRKRQKLAEMSAAQAQVQGAMLAANAETAAAWARWDASPTALNAALGAVKAANAFYEIEQVRFKAGKATLAELLEAHQALAEAEANEAEAIRFQRVSWAMLMASMGLVSLNELALPEGRAAGVAELRKQDK
jgi:outer membrane protein